MFDVLLAFLHQIIECKTKYTRKVVKKQAGGSKKSFSNLQNKR